MEAIGFPPPVGWDDQLTGLAGPDFWQRILVTEVARSDRYRRPLTVVIAELEGVDELPATWGMEIARHIVREAAQCLGRASRAGDHCTRIGVAKFGIVLTETDEISAINFVERVRAAGPRLVPGGTDGLQFNFGWASPIAGESAEAVVRRAESRLLAEIKN